MTSSINSKLGTAVITGASAGFGSIYAKRLAQRGYDLLLVARREERLNELAASLRKQYSVKVQVKVADLTKQDDLESVAEILSSDPSISMLVNNAGTSTFGGTEKLSAAAMNEMLGLNITALARLSLAVFGKFLERNAGTLINIGSVLGYGSLPFSTVYSGTKSFVLTFTRGLQIEAANTAVKVQLVAPAASATDIWYIAGLPLSNLDPKAIMSPEACVDAALRGLDLGEPITMPSLEQTSIFDLYDQTRGTLFGAMVSNGTPASRYASD